MFPKTQISDRTRHDTLSVHAFKKLMIQELQCRNIPMTHIHYISDGAASQYKNCKASCYNIEANHKNFHKMVTPPHLVFVKWTDPPSPPFVKVFHKILLFFKCWLPLYLYFRIFWTSQSTRKTLVFVRPGRSLQQVMAKVHTME